MSKEKKEIILTPYQENVHTTGKIWFFVAYAGIIAFPLVSSIYFNAWPELKTLFQACLGVVPTFWTVGFIEAFTYMPMLGAGGSYLGFVTGNMSNIKVPVAVQAMDQAGVKQGTEEGDCISTIAIAVSSIVTTIIIIIFVLLMVPLTPVFTNPVLTPAFTNVVPALFGGLMVAFIAKDIKVGAPIIALAVVLFVALPVLDSIYPLLFPVFIGLAVILARTLYKKGKI